MTIIVNKSYGVTLPEGNVLGYPGEHLLRVVRVIHPEFEGDYYGLRLDYGGGVVYECSIENGEMPVSGSLLSAPCTLTAQFFADVPGEEGESDRVFESETFTLTVGESVGTDTTPIPTYEEAQSILVYLKGLIAPSVQTTCLHTPAAVGFAAENEEE